MTQKDQPNFDGASAPLSIPVSSQSKKRLRSDFNDELLSSDPSAYPFPILDRQITRQYDKHLDPEWVQNNYFTRLTDTCPICLDNKRRKLLAGVDLVGIESNPGPRAKTSKKVTKVIEVERRPAKKRTRSRKTKTATSLSRNISSSSIPAGYIFDIPSSYFKMGGSPQKMADQDPSGGVRCSGGALLGTPISVYYTGTSSGPYGALSGSGAPGRAYDPLSPNNIDPRLAAIANCFQYYAFRKICLTYVPSVGSTTSGVLQFAIAKDPEMGISQFAIIGDATGSSSGTTQQLMDVQPSKITSVWQPKTLEFKHTGVKLWETFPNGEEPEIQRIQAMILAIVSGTSVTTATATLFGYLWLEYEIDLYVPGPPLGSN